MTDKGEILLAVIAVMGPVATAWLTSRRSRKTEAATAKIQGRTVEGEAYDRARKIDQGVVDGLRTEVDRLREDLKEERAGRLADSRRHAQEIAQIRAEHAEEIGALRELVSALQTELHVTRTQLGMPGVTPPTDRGDGG